jgi:acyl dehydratase
MIGKYFEDLNKGDKFATLARTITETEILNYIALTGMYEELFMNIEYIKSQSIFKRRVAPGALVYGIAEGLVVTSGLIHGTGLAFLGLNDLKIPAPVACGDTINVEVEVIDKRQTRKLGRGVVTFKHRVKNQKGETVMVFDVSRLMKRKKEV